MLVTGSVAAQSIVHQVNGERLIVLGWSRAILMQLAHPLLAAGVSRHSSFKGRASEAAVRLHHTVGAMLSLLFGDERTRAETVAHIRAIHRTVKGTLGAPAGPFPPDAVYSAEDPALLLWVHVTLVDSSVLVYERLIGPLSARDRDRLCNDAVPTLIELGGDPQSAPRRWSAIEAELARMLKSGALVVTPEGREVATAVLEPRAAFLPIPFTGWHRLVTIGLLPPAIRAAYGFEWDAGRQARLERVLSTIRAARRVTPGLVARWSQARERREE